MKKKVFWALLAVGTTFLSTGVVSAQSTTGLSGVGLLGEFKKKSLIGTWEETFTFIDGPQKGRVSVALVSYHDDGTSGGGVNQATLRSTRRRKSKVSRKPDW